MPVPLIYADKPLQVVGQRNVGQAWGEVGALGRAGVQLAENISRQQAELRANAKTAEDNLAAIEYSNNVQKDIRDLSGLFENDNDPFTIEKRASEQVNAIGSKYAPKNPSDQLDIKTKSIFNQEMNNFLNGIQTKKYQLLDSKGKEEYLKAEQTAIDAINSTNDPVEQGRIKKNLEGIKDSLPGTDQLWLEKEWIGFDAKAKSIGETKAITAAKNFMIENPAGGSKALKAMPFWDKVPPERKPELITSADNTAVTYDKKRQDEIEKIQKVQVNVNDSQAVADFYDGKLTWEDLKNRRQTNIVSKQISEATFNSLSEKVNKGIDAENNPVIVGNLAERIGRGEDVGILLLDALNKNQIKPETYISMKKALGNERSSAATKILNQALAPSMLDRWSPDKNLRHSEATVSMMDKISSGMDPVVAANDVISEYTGHIVRTRNGLPTPKYLEGDKSDIVALEKASQVTATAYELGTMQPEEYKRQMQMIDDLKKLTEDRNRLEESNKELEKLKKQVKR